MYKLIPAVAAFALVGSVVVYAATSASATTTQVQSAPPVIQPTPPVYHEANTASQTPTPTVRNTQATNQEISKKSGGIQASVGKMPPEKVATAMPTSNSDEMNLASQLGQVSSRIHSAHQAGKLTKLQYARLHNGLTLLWRNIDRAHDRYGRELPNLQLWTLDGQIHYLSTEVNKLVG